MNLDFSEILLEVVAKKASDLHITAGAPPMLRVRGALVPIEGTPRLTATDTREIVYAILMLRTLIASLLVPLLLGVFQLCTALRLAGRLSIRRQTLREYCGWEECHGEQSTHDNGSPLQLTFSKQPWTRC